MKTSLFIGLLAKHLHNFAVELEGHENNSPIVPQETPKNKKVKKEVIKDESNKDSQKTSQETEIKSETSQEVELPPVIPQVSEKEEKIFTLEDFKRLGADVCRAAPSGRAKIQEILNKLGVDHSSKLTVEQLQIACPECISFLHSLKAENEY